MTQPGQTPVSAQIVVPKSDIPPDAANWFHFSLANLDVQMVVGYIDPQQAGEFVQAVVGGNKDVQPIKPIIVRRIMMSMSGFSQLLAQIHEMERKMREAGVQFIDDELAKKRNG